MTEQLKLIETQLYKSEITFPIIRERLLLAGELKAWYRWYRGGNQWAKKFFREENVFLMTSSIIWCQIDDDGQIRIHQIKPDEFAKIEHSYEFESKNSQKLILTEVLATLRVLDEKRKTDVLVFKRPLLEEQGDAEGFERFMEMFDKQFKL
ncbi:MAG: hypothetical protein PHC92_02170 [Syntrophomonadaceae bacterium]|nr:hypothetical protein [Syntrophomonadaceae bacterium]MDD3022556.1 hypothetical protein [Syntrophomonadaceae bacterium]